MKIYVLVKQVPDTEAAIKVQDTGISEGGIKWIISPFDDHALEESLRLKEKTQGTITAVSLGPQRSGEALKTALALGADRAVHIQDDEYNPLDIVFAARTLGAFLKKEGADIVLTGNAAIDSQSSMTPAMIAEILGCPIVQNAIEVEIKGEKIRCKRDIEGGTAFMETAKPLVITAAKNLNEPRYPSLKGIMAAKKKSVEVLPAAEVPGSDTLARINVVSMESPPARPPGRIIEGDSIPKKVEELVRLLREEARVI